MQLHAIRVSPEAARLPRDAQLAHKLARLVAEPVPVESEVQDMIVNRIIDNAAVAVAALNRPAPAT
ncbi:MAG: MmgE/PrpD family protein, partial [Methyloligellaceae bacterium]